MSMPLLEACFVALLLPAELPLCLNRKFKKKNLLNEINFINYLHIYFAVQ